MNFDERMTREADRFGDHPGRTLLRWGAMIIAVCVVLSVVVSLFSTGNVFFQAAKAKLTAAPRVTSKIYETENIIAKVALFHDRCTQVNEKIAIFKNNYQRYKADREAVKDATGLDKQSASESMSNDISDYTAALNAAETAAQEYNSASAQYTQSPFKSQDLPYRIELPAGNASASYAFRLNCH